MVHCTRGPWPQTSHTRTLSGTKHMCRLAYERPHRSTQYSVKLSLAEHNSSPPFPNLHNNVPLN